jgi:choline-sulfatase
VASGERDRAARLEPLNVLLITVDALRADMPWAGYPRQIAPNLTRLAAESVVYTHAYALSSYTSMSLGGLMAGRYPLELPRDGRATSRFFDDALFLAELLAGAKVRTIGVHGHVYFLGDTGIRQGFEDWRVVPRITLNPAREGAVTDDQLAAIAISALDEAATKKDSTRFFAWVHFMDPHFDYAPHAGQERFRGPSYAPDASAAPPGTRLNEVGQGLKNRYDGEVLFTDAQVGRLIAHVRAAPWGKATAIVVTSDHGEAFGEQKSYFEHGFHVYEVTTRVPLLFAIPGVRPARFAARRSHIDLARTLLELAGVPAPASFRGKSLVPELLGGAAPEERDVVIDMPYTDQTPRRRALIHGRYKIIVTETEPRPLLYDLEADPAEQHDLAAERADVLADMKRRWEAMNATIPDYQAERRGRRQY